MRFSASFLSIILVFLSLAMPLSLAGCLTEDAATVDQDRIYADYWLYYDEATDTTTVRAAFRLGHALGTLLRLTGESRVSFEGMPLSFNADLGTHERQIAGLVDGGTFEYVNAEGTVFRNTVGHLEPIALPSDLTELSRAVGATIAWTGSPVAESQSVVVGARTDRILDIQLSSERTFGASTVRLDPAQLDRLPAGTVYVGLQRFEDYAVAEGGATRAGAHVWSTYTATERTVTVR